MKQQWFILPVLLAMPMLLQSQSPDKKESMERGKALYSDFCVSCHMENGEGVAGVFPPLAASDYLKREREASIRGVKFGQSGEIVVNGVTYDSMMMAMGLEDEEIADVMNYIMNAWGNQNDRLVTPDEVAAIEEN
jgi:mono/diheme cytochrome c family protein